MVLYIYSSACQGPNPALKVRSSPFPLTCRRVGGTCYVFLLPISNQQPYHTAHQGEDQAGSTRCKVHSTPAR